MFNTYFQHITECFHLHWSVWLTSFLNVPLTQFFGFSKVALVGKASPVVFWFDKTRNDTNDLNLTAFSDVKCLFLAHLSWRLRGDLSVYQSLRRPLPVRLSSVNIFKHLLLWHHWANWTQISYENSLGWGHMTNMAATPKYGETPLKIFFSRTRRPMIWDLICNIRGVGPTKFVQIIVLGWPWPT